MGKGKSGGTTSGGKSSSGNSQKNRIKKALMRTNMKIARWERYKKEGRACSGKTKWRIGWNTSGLKKHAELLQSLI
jgi:hypothetical protein